MITVQNDIRIDENQQMFLNFCNRELILDNPEYYRLEKMGKWTGNTPKTISLFEKDGDELIIPFGCFKRLYQLFPQGNWTSKITPMRRLKYKSNIELYDYQQTAVEAVLKAKNGILVMPCGSGKTQCGLETIACIGGKALWLTHTSDLLNQSKKRAESVLEIDSYNAFGMITAGKVDIGTHITFATVQTMSKINLAKYRDEFDVIVVDECHHCCGSPTRVTQFYKVVSSLSARYKIGLTATPKRADGLHVAMFALLGDIIYEGESVMCPIKVKQIETNWYPDTDKILNGDGTIDYNALINELTEDTWRLQKVVEYIKELKGSKLVLGNRLLYLEVLRDLYGGNSVFINGSAQTQKAKRERKEALEKLNNGEIDCVFCTYALAAEGLDCPNLRHVVFVTPEKNETTIIQSVGRVGRIAKGKDYGTVIDFVDDFGIYQNWAGIRRKYYRKLGAEIL